MVQVMAKEDNCNEIGTFLPNACCDDRGKQSVLHKSKKA